MVVGIIRDEWKNFGWKEKKKETKMYVLLQNFWVPLRNFAHTYNAAVERRIHELHWEAGPAEEMKSKAGNIPG